MIMSGCANAQPPPGRSPDVARHGQPDLERFLISSGGQACSEAAADQCHGRHERRSAVAQHLVVQRQGGRPAPRTWWLRLRAAPGRYEAGHCIGRLGDLPRGGAARSGRRAVPKLSDLRCAAAGCESYFSNRLRRLYDGPLPITASTRVSPAYDAPSMILIRPRSPMPERTKAESQRPTILTTKQGVKIGIAAATFSLNGLPVPNGKPWAVHRLTRKELLAQAHRARAAGADIVLAAVHIGTEYSTRENTSRSHLLGH